MGKMIGMVGFNALRDNGLGRTPHSGDKNEPFICTHAIHLE